jgi:hypothetical protein
MTDQADRGNRNASIEREEARERFENLLSGPWEDEGTHARQVLRPARDLTPLADERRPIAREELVAALAPEDRPESERQARLSRSLRPHWGGAITDRDELALRNSFDWALTAPQLVELAVETGYVDLDTVYVPARRMMLDLTWSDGAVSFISDYYYVPVRFLAARLGIDLGLPAVAPPAPKPDAEVRFASFLAAYRDLIGSRTIQRWLAFLDWFRTPAQHAVFREAYETGELPPDASDREYVRGLARGAYRFLTSLGDLFSVLHPGERQYFGLFFAYWIARLYGYQIRPEGYIGTGRRGFIQKPENLVRLVVEDDADGPSGNDQMLRDLERHYVEGLRKATELIAISWKETLSLQQRTIPTLYYGDLVAEGDGLALVGGNVPKHYRLAAAPGLGSVDALLGKRVTILGLLGATPEKEPVIHVHKALSHETISSRASEIARAHPDRSPEGNWVKAERELLFARR